MDPTNFGLPFNTTVSPTGSPAKPKNSPSKSPSKPKHSPSKATSSSNPGPDTPLRHLPLPQIPSSPSSLQNDNVFSLYRRKRNIASLNENEKPEDDSPLSVKRVGGLFKETHKSAKSSKPPSSFLLTQPPQSKGRDFRNVKSPLTITYDAQDNKIDLIVIHGKEYPITLIGNGVLHLVYKFTESTFIELDGKKISTDELVIKVNNVRNKNPKQLLQNIKDDIDAYQKLASIGVPLPECFVNPATFVDQKNPDMGGYWIVKKMVRNVSCNGWGNQAELKNLSADDQKVLNFVKSYLTLSAKEGKEIINDLYPRNLMFDVKGNINVIDFSPAAITDKAYSAAEIAFNNFDFHYNLFSYLKAWSNGNEKIFNFLTSDFPEEIKKIMQERLEAAKLANKGNFPVSDQTHKK